MTFNRDIAPIVHEKCASCHRPGQAGPFPLLTYDDVARRARTIEAVIDVGYMPPWKPVNQNVKFANDRRLTESQQKLIKQWIADGRPKGEGPGPQPPNFADGWVLGEPDLVIRMNGRFEVPAAGPDIYRSFVFPLQLNEDKWIKAIEYRPTARSAVHHALFFLDQNGNARRLDGTDGKPGIAGMGFLGGESTEDGPHVDSGLKGLMRWRLDRNGPGQLDTGSVERQLSRGLGGYVPGTTPARLPRDLAMELPQGSDIVMQTHFHPSGTVEVEQGQLAIYFADGKPSQKIVPIQVPAMFGIGVGMKIPAGNVNYRVTESFEVPVDVELIHIGAHAHYICRQARMTATLPDGTNLMLLDINDWDLDWQDRYYFRDQIVLPAGTVLTTQLVYDNSADNPENPNHPPREIRWGRESGDEMGSASVYVVAANQEDHAKLLVALQRHFIESITRGDIVELLMQLDSNHDGGLQPLEAPPRLSRRFNLMDRNRDGKLDRSELELIRRFLPGSDGRQN